MGTYDISKINNWFNDFTSARNKFNNKYYSDFANSYIRNCNDSAVINMYNKLNQHYEKIKRINLRVNNIWDDFLFDVQAIDNRLAGQHVNARDSLISSKLSKIQNLEEYEHDLNTKISSLSAKVGIVDKIGLAENKSASENFAEVFERCGATVATFTTSLLEGVVKLGEDGMDLLVLAGAVKASGYTSMIDLKNYITAEVKGDDSLKTNKTEQLWEDTRSFVSQDFTGFAFDSFYKNTQVGQWMKENAYGFDSVRAVGSEVGEVIAVTALSAVTGGSAAVIYGAAKTAEHTEENWQDQNVSTTGGLLKGMLQGSLDGAFFALGAKGDNIMKAAASSAVKQGEKIVLKKTAILFGKTMFECGCSIVQDESSILVNTIFSNNTICDVNGEVLEFKNFKDKWNYYYKQAGGNEGLVISMATAGILSFTSDAMDVNKIMKNTSVDTAGTRKSMSNSKNMDVSSGSKKINSDVNIDSLKKEYNELLNKSKESWFVNAKEAGDNHWAWDLNEVDEVDKTIKRMKELEGTLGIKETGVPESKIHDYSGVKKEADELVHKISKEPIPGFENINTNSPEYKKTIQDMYSKLGPSEKQNLSQIESQFSKNGNLDLNKTYSENFDKFSKDGISYEQYATQNGINIKEYGSEMDLALDVGDENWYLVQVIKNNVDEKNWPTAIKKPRSELNTNELINAAGPFLKQKDIINLNEIEKRLNMKNLSLQNQNTLSQFQRAGGCEINGMLRGKNYSDYGILSLYELEMEMNNSNPRSGYGGANQKHPRLVNKNYSIVDEIDDIIKNNCNTSTIKGVSYLTSVGSDVPTKRVLDIIDSFGSNSPEALQAVQDLIGLDITDSAYNSKTIPPTRNTEYSKKFYNKVRGDIESLDIKVESYISPGCGAYIDTYGGIKDGLGEMLIKRNCNQKIVDAYIDPNTSKLVLVTLYT